MSVIESIMERFGYERAVLPSDSNPFKDISGKSIRKWATRNHPNKVVLSWSIGRQDGIVRVNFTDGSTGTIKPAINGK